jgi:hypothetical protein
MTGEHPIELERAVGNAGFKETFRGAAWSTNCRECVYVDCILPIEELRRVFKVHRISTVGHRVLLEAIGLRRNPA